MIFSSVYIHTGQAKVLPDYGGNRTRDVWFASPMLCQLSYEVKSVRVCDISCDTQRASPILFLLRQDNGNGTFLKTALTTLNMAHTVCSIANLG